MYPVSFENLSNFFEIGVTIFLTTCSETTSMNSCREYIGLCPFWGAERGGGLSAAERDRWLGNFCMGLIGDKSKPC